MKRVIKSSAVTSQDDRYLFQFIYDYYKNWEEFPTYEEVLDEYDESVGRRSYKDATDRVSNGLAYISFYSYDGVEYIQLMHDPVLSWIRIPEEAASRLGEEAIEHIYLERVERAKEEFLSKTGTEIYQLGRSGRHICVEDTIDNLLNSKQLYETAVQLEKDVISYMNNLT